MEKQARPFVDFLGERASTHRELSDKLNELATAVIETGKKGELVLKVKMKPAGEGMVVIDDDVALKAPEGDRASAIYFVDDDANLQRNDPSQRSFEDLREVPRADNVREIS